MVRKDSRLSLQSCWESESFGIARIFVASASAWPIQRWIVGRGTSLAAICVPEGVAQLVERDLANFSALGRLLEAAI